MTPTKRVLLIAAAVSVGLMAWATNKPSIPDPFAHLSRPCRAAAWQAPLDFPELSAIRKSERHERMQYLGECNAEKVTDVLWYVSGIHYNNWMKEDRRPPVRYEAIIYEDNNPSDLHVQREGTQYSTCSVAAEGVDRTSMRYKQCGTGAYIFEFKKLHKLK